MTPSIPWSILPCLTLLNTAFIVTGMVAGPPGEAVMSAAVQWESQPGGACLAQVGDFRVEVRPLRFGAPDGWGPWAVVVGGRHLTTAETLEGAQAEALRRLPANDDGSVAVRKALRVLAAAIVARHEAEGDWDERLAWQGVWDELSSVAESLGQDLALPLDLGAP